MSGLHRRYLARNSEDNGTDDIITYGSEDNHE